MGCQPKRETAEKSRVKYFTKLTGIVSPYMAYRPRGEVTLEWVKTMPHYKVSYNLQGQIDEIRYFKYGKSNNDSYFGTHRVKYTRTADSLVRHYFDAQGNKAHMERHYYGGGAIHQEVFLLDAVGHKKELHLKDSLGQRTATGFGTYRFLWKAQNTNTFIQEQYKKEGGRNILTDYFPFYKAKIELDKKGHLYRITNLDTVSNKPIQNENSGYAKVVFNFDAHGNEGGWSFHNLKGELVVRKQAQGMEFGYAKVRYDFDWEDQALGWSRSFSMNFLDADQHPVRNNEGIHSTWFEFDAHDNLTGLAYFDELEIAIMHPIGGYHKLKITYGEEGTQTEVTRFDANGEPIR